MGILPIYLPDDSPSIPTAFQIAQEIVFPLINCASAVMFTLATYNLAGSNLVNYAQDQPGKTYFADLRGKEGLNLGSFAAGVVSAAADQGTSSTLATPDSLKNLTLMNLQQLRDPWGRAYLAIAQEFGPLWGIT